MKSKFAFTTFIALCAFALGAGFNNIALSDGIETGGIKLAVVDVNEVVSKSSQVKTLKKQQETKKAELVKWLDVVKEDINKQQTEEGKVKLAKKYDAELAKKQEANKEEYAKKLSEIDKSISNIISQTAKAQGYSMVFAKSTVLYGGDDLTAVISKAVK